MKKNNFYYFKKTLLLSVPIATFIIIKELFEIDLTDTSIIIKIFVKGISVGILTSIIMGIINIFAKVETFMKKK
ncbi:MAG: hypothetical protein ACI9SI_000125 [Polaribacter sp.]|jgi:hypothetical protein